MTLRRRTLFNLALMGGVALLALIAWLGGDEEQPAPPALLTNIAPAVINHITVERGGNDALRFERKGKDWRMTTPVNAPAHPARLGSVLQLLAEPVHARLPLDDAARQRFGLAAPAVRVILDEQRIAFGDTNPLDDRRYVEYGGEACLISDKLYVQLTQGPGFFLDNRLLPEGVKLTRIRYPDRVLEYDGATWRSTPETGLGADAAAAVALAWGSVRAVTVRLLQPAVPAGRVSLETLDGQKIEFDIVQAEDTPLLVRADAGLQYHLDALAARQLLLLPQEPDAETGSQ